MFTPKEKHDYLEIILRKNIEYIVMGKMINYGDGNGNQYVIEQDSIEYKPIEPKFSSSGIYDGGEHMKKTITQHEYEKIASVFTKAMTNEASHVKNRVKGSGAISIQEGSSVKLCILSPNSEKLNEIERLLKAILK